MTMICTEYDEYIHQYYESLPRWEAYLFNGLRVYQDDGRPGTNKSAWERLRDYCLQEQVGIKEMKIAFRDNSISLPSNKSAYYFRNRLECMLKSEKQFKFFIVGYKDKMNSKINCKVYSVPDLILRETEERDFDVNDLSLIISDWS